MFSHSPYLAGAERALLELVDQLVSHGRVECHVVVPFSGPLIRELESSGAKIIHATYQWWCTRESISPKNARKRLGEDLLHLATNTLEQVSALDPDVICTNSLVIPYGAVCASQLNKPHIWLVQEWGGERQGLEFFLPYKEVLAFVEEASAYVFGATKTLCQSLFPNLDIDRCDHLYPEIKFPSLTSSPGEAENLFSPEGVRVAEFASLIPAKKLGIAIEAIAKVRKRGLEVNLLLAGDADPTYSDSLKKTVEELGLEKCISIQDFILDVYPVMSAAEIILVSDPSHALGRVAVEGMLMGKPVIYPYGSDIEEYMEDGSTGLGYDAGDSLAMADRIATLAADASLRSEIGEKARRKAKATFTKEGFGDKFLQQALALKGTTGSNLSPPGMFKKSITEAVERQEKEIGGLQREVSGLQVEIGSSRAALAAKSEELDSIKPVLGAREAELESIKPILQEREDELASIKPTLAERDEEIESLKSTLAARETDLEASSKTLQTSQRVLASRDEELVSIRLVLKAKELELTELKPILDARERELGSVKPVLKARDEELAALKPKLQTSAEELALVQSKALEKEWQLAKLRETWLGRLALRLAKVE